MKLVNRRLTVRRWGQAKSRALWCGSGNARRHGATRSGAATHSRPPGTLGLRVSVNSRPHAFSVRDRISSPLMHKTPSQIARSLRAFWNAHRLGLLQSVCILPGPEACQAAHSQVGVEYRGDAVPGLPLKNCTRDTCECKYAPVGSDQFRRLNAPRKRPAKLP